jgi:hypothetical protein
MIDHWRYSQKQVNDLYDKNKKREKYIAKFETDMTFEEAKDCKSFYRDCVIDMLQNLTAEELHRLFKFEWIHNAKDIDPDLACDNLLLITINP